MDNKNTQRPIPPKEPVVPKKKKVEGKVKKKSPKGKSPQKKSPATKSIFSNSFLAKRSRADAAIEEGEEDISGIYNLEQNNLLE